MPRRKVANEREISVEDYEFREARRSNNPPAGLAHLDRDETPVRVLTYDPHLDPQLEWAGKFERERVEVPAPSIHVHEELSAQKIVGAVRRQRLQHALFDVAALDPAAAVEFYEHDLDWTNRMVLGDSLMVMASLVDRERLAGRVQCVYMDPPYGINYRSNFQPTIGDKVVKDDDKSLTREPEMIQAYRDTWELNVHSYLSYLRDRFSVARELLHHTGSVFVQIGPDRLHLVKAVLDEVFGASNSVTTITMQKTSQVTSKLLPEVADFICWYAKDKNQIKFRHLYEDRSSEIAGAGPYRYVELANGDRRSMTEEERGDLALLPEGARVFRYSDATSQGFSPTKTVDFVFDGRPFRPKPNRHWLLRPEGMQRLAELRRLDVGGEGESLSYIRYADETGYMRRTNVWTDTGQAGFAQRSGARYVVETNPKAVARALLMTTDPGDLVIDPTCGSGTTAAVAEQYGRRWITIDTSRVALSIARERLLTSKFDYYQLADPDRGIDGGLRFHTFPWVRASDLGYDHDEVEDVPLYDQPLVDRKKVRVSGPFTVEALSRYAVSPVDQPPSDSNVANESQASDHVETLLTALRTQGIPRPGSPPAPIESLSRLAAAGALQAEGIVDLGGRRRRFAVALGPKFGAVTMAQVGDALREAIGFDVVVFAGFAVSADAQDRLATGRVGGVQVALLLANPDLLVGDLLKSTPASQTFRLYSSPDVRLEVAADGLRINVEGVDTFDAATGEVVSYGRAGVQAWFLDADYDGTVFRVSQAFFPVTEAWSKLQAALRGTVDADLIAELHSWTSLPFWAGDQLKAAVRIITQDGNASEVILDLPKGPAQ